MDSLDFNTATAFDFTVDDLARTDEHSASERLAAEILEKVLQFRRVHPKHEACSETCSSCQLLHLSKIVLAVEEARPVTFVLPAFPGKSPNLAKVLGTLPDLGERLALQFLETLCEQIQEIYSPGAQIIICSDGRVFSDVVGMTEANVTDYQHELDRMIEDLKLKNISTFNLDQLGKDQDLVLMRQELMEQFGMPLEMLREKILRGANPFSRAEDIEAHRMYLGITRFLVEDSSFPGQTKSRTAIQKECKAKSYEVIRRSNAWSELIEQEFPEAVRLSIHPQGCGAKKIGIRLVGADSWMTPWHGVAVETADGVVLMKRHDAEALGARLVVSTSGRASHFELPMNLSTGFQAEVAT